MSKRKRSGRSNGMAWIRARRAQTRLPEWLWQPLTPHEPVYNPAIKVGALRWATARYPKICFLVWLVPAMLAWPVFFIFSLRQASAALITYALLELPFLLGLLYLLWPMLLYRLTGLPRPAARPSGRSATQMSARNFYRGSCATLIFLAGNAVVIGMWLVAVAFAQYDSASVFVIVFVSLLLLPVLVPIFKVVWEIGGLFRHRPNRSMPEQRSDLIPEDGGKRVRKPRRRKTPENQQVYTSRR